MKTQLVHQSIEQLESKNSRAGYHFFDPSTKRFFSSRISSDTFAGADGWYFVTSEQQWPDYTNHLFYPRLYSVRRMDEQGKVDTMGEFQAYKTGEQAKRAARRMANESLNYTQAEDEKRLAELRLSDTGTCPTTNGHDLELWEQVLQERKQEMQA